LAQINMQRAGWCLIAVMMSEPMRTAPELYAHAIAIEREAQQRYDELAQYMSDLGNDTVAAAFARLGAVEGEHLRTLLARTDHVPMPELQADEFRWLDAGAPETAAHELVYRFMTPRMALKIALGAERRAEAFFERVYRSAEDPALHALAQEMAMEEKEHVAAVERLLERTPDPNVDWAALLEDGDARSPARLSR
jgi:rubrerythrin